MRRLLASLLVLAPLAAFAGDRCPFEAPRQLHADLAGVRVVEIDVHSYDLHVAGRPGAAGLDLRGRACASDRSVLDSLTVSQRREGDRLLIELGGGAHRFTWFGSGETSLDVQVDLPEGVDLLVDVGSGDADVAGVHTLDAHVGSGDLEASRIAGLVRASVGSGDIKIAGAGALELGSVGSGDVVARQVHGPVNIGSVGSGDVTLAGVEGDVHAQTLGSGDIDVREVAGTLRLDAKGSGDLNYRDVKGKVSVPRDD